ASTSMGKERGQIMATNTTNTRDGATLPDLSEVPTAAVPPSQEVVSYPRLRVLLTMAGLLLALLLSSSLDGTIVGTAMPRIIGALQGFDRYTWVTTGYPLTVTVMIPIYGKLC